MPPSLAVSKAAWAQIDDDFPFQSLSEAEAAGDEDVQALRAQVLKLQRQLRGRDSGPASIAAAPAAGSEDEDGDSSGEDEDDLLAVARRVQKQVLAAARSGGGTRAAASLYVDELGNPVQVPESATSPLLRGASGLVSRGGPAETGAPTAPLRSMLGTGAAAGASRRKALEQTFTGWPGGLPPTGADLSVLVQLELLRELRRSRDLEEDKGEQYIDGARGVGKTLKSFHKLRKRVIKDPESIITSYVERMREQVGVAEGQPWTMMDVNRRLAWGKFKTLQRMHFVLANVFQQLDEGNYRVAQALCVQGMKCAHQASLDNGEFELAWLLTGLPDPLKKEKFGGEPEELEVLGQYLKSLAEIEKRSKNRPKAADEEEEPKPKPKGAGKDK